MTTTKPKGEGMMDGKIILSNGSVETTWQDVKRAVLSEIAVEDMDCMYAFGSAIKPYKTKTIVGDSGGFGWFKYKKPDEIITIYPKDVDVLVLLKEKPTKTNWEVAVKATYDEYGNSCGYSFSYPVTGYKRGILHVTAVSSTHWKEALKRKDPDTVRIASEAVPL